MSPPRKTRTDEAFGIVPARRADDGQWLFLLIQHNAGHWAFPKGHADPGESPESAARRELCEETGIRDITLVHPEPFAESYRIVSKKWFTDKTVWFYVGVTTTAAVTCQPEEVQAHVWLPAPAAHQRLTFDASRNTLKTAQSLLNN